MSKATLEAQVSDIRGDIRSLLAERANLAKHRFNRQETAARIESMVSGFEIEGRTAMQFALRSIAVGNERGDLLHLPGTPGAHGIVSIPVGPLLVHMLGAGAVRNALLAELDAVPDLPPAAERAARINEIDAELDRLETAEEALIVESETTAHPIDRRADARPEIVLAVVESASAIEAAQGRATQRFNEARTRARASLAAPQ